MVRSPAGRRIGAATAVIALVVAVLTGCTGHSTTVQERAARAFLDALARRDTAAAAALTTGPTAARTALDQALSGLGPAARASFTVTTGHGSDRRYSLGFSARWTLAPGAPHWNYTGALAMTRTDGSWRVVWSPADLYPGLRAGETPVVVHTQPARAALLDSDGKPLFVPTAVVRVGIEPELVTDLSTLAPTLAAVPELQSSAQDIVTAVKSATDPTEFVPVITLRRTVYDGIRARIHDLPGVVFQEDSELLPPSSHFGEPLLGTVGPATADQIAHSNGRLIAGDEAGTGGLQQAYDAQLAGRPGLTVDARTSDGSTRRLASISGPTEGTPVRLTLDRSVQTAAETALASVPQAAAIVAVQRSTGRILADANTPATTYDYGLAGAFPPGSTFKIATWTAAFSADPTLSASTLVQCPATYTVDGRQFVNENRFSYPPIPVSSAFGYSCNTSAMIQAMALPRTAVVDAAARLGLGARWRLPVPAFSGSAPAPASPTEQAADAIGQGRVLASPLLMALMAGAASSGTVRTPTLSASQPSTQTATLPTALARTMTTLMTATVALPKGTAHELSVLPTTIGKTGTAEYGTAVPPRSHAWFAGVQGDIAFAVFVYDGASQHVDPAAVALRFLRSTPGR